MKTPEKQDQDTRQPYEAPRLEIVSLRGDEVLAGSCKDITGAGPQVTCQGVIAVCSALGS